MDHIITAVFTPGTTETVAQDALYQWAYGQTLRLEGIELPEAYQVDFSNFEFCGESIPQIGGPDGVPVPVEVLATGAPVYAFVWAQSETAGRTWCRVEIRVIPRPVPDLDTPSPEEESAIAKAIAALNDGVDAAEAQAVLAESWAVGGTGTREGEDTNNAKYWAEQAQGGGGGGGGTTDYNALSNRPAINGHTLQGNQTAAQLGLATPSDIPAVPTKTSELTNDSGFVDAAGAAAAAHVQSVNGKTGEVVLSAADVGAGTYSKPAGGIPASDLAPGVIPAVPTKTSELSNDSGFVGAAGAAAAAPVQSVNGKTGAVVLSAADVGAGTYSKPATGIPATDLASPVRTSLEKADSALQAVPSTYRTAEAQDAIDSGKVDTADYSPEAKTAEMTQPVGKDSSGKLWTVPGSGGEEIISNANVLLASGTADAGITSAAVGDGLVDTGLTLGDLRQYKYFYIKIRLDEGSPYLGFRIGNTNYQIKNSNAIYAQFTWLDNAKTALMPTSYGYGNSGVAGAANKVANNTVYAMGNLLYAGQWLGAIPIGSAADTAKIYVGITSMNGLAETTKSMIWGVFGMGAYS